MKYDLGNQFDVYPMGRPLGAQFREMVLVPMLRQIERSNTTEKLEISFESCRSFGSSFLEEAFGGLVRKGLFSKAFLLDRLNITAVSSSKIFFVKMTLDYIRNSKPERLS